MIFTVEDTETAHRLLGSLAETFWDVILTTTDDEEILARIVWSDWGARKIKYKRVYVDDEGRHYIEQYGDVMLTREEPNYDVDVLKAVRVPGDDDE